MGRAELRRVVPAPPSWPIDNVPLEPGRRSRVRLVAGEARGHWRYQLTMGTVTGPKSGAVGNGAKVVEGLCRVQDGKLAGPSESNKSAHRLGGGGARL